MAKAKISVFVVLCLLGFATLAPVPQAYAHGPKHMNALIEESQSDTCEHSQTHFGDDLQTFYADERQTIAAPATLELVAARNGGVKVIGADRNDIAITVCKAAGADDKAKADAILSQVKLVVEGSHVTVIGPQGERWGAHLTLQVPAAQALRLETHNGPASVSSLSGTLELKTVNGPLAINKVSGTVRAEAQNGPVALRQASGDIEINAQNGPVMVELTGDSWTGRGLNAVAHNGPVQLNVPRGFTSGMEVEVGNGPFSCDLKDCGHLRGPIGMGRGKTVKLGGEPVLVHLRTDHGPVAIKSSTM